MADEKAQHAVTARISETDRRRLEALRRAEERSRSAMVRRALRVGLDVLEQRAARSEGS
ncbi:MAG: ribbon-helix-helix protein, CopG family [Planctomycetota bacterium]|nr:ribbon-helix-helix protein, CopG family [Planctomycetota bacterium]